MTLQTQCLRWGDLVRIHGVNLTNKKMPKGLIIAKGFTDCNLYYQTYEDFSQVNFYRESLFQIIPKSNFDDNQQKVDQDANDKSKELQRKQALKIRAALQKQNLDSQLQAKAGKQIFYGAQVAFRHVQSKQYLCGVLKAADIGVGAFKLQLKTDLSKQIIFQIRSHRTYQHEGNNIYYDDCLQLYHVQSDCYVNFPPNANSVTFLDIQHKLIQPGKSQQYFKYFCSRPKIKRPLSIRIPIINQNKPKCLWKFINHCSFSDSLSKQKIKSHDIVYFQHTKNKGLVASTLNDMKYYLKEEIGKGEAPSYQCFWEILPKEVNQYGPETCNVFWARNIVTGQILTYQGGFQVEVEAKDKIDDGGFKSQGLVNLICSYNQKEHQKLMLERDQFIPLDQNMPKIQRYFQQKILKMQFKAVASLPQDSFIIVKVQDQTIRDVAYVLSSHESLVKFIEIFSSKLLDMTSKTQQTYKRMFLQLNEDFLKNVVKILKLLCGKIYDADYEEIQTSGKIPIKQIQKILVQTGIPQLLIEIVYLLFQPFIQIERNNQPSEDKAIRLRLVQIFSTSYKLLQKIANSFQDNRIYLSRWVQLFLSHAKKINKPFIQQTLVCILQNNPVSIQYTISQPKIQQLIQSFLLQANQTQASQELTTKYMRLFSTFIKCQNRVLKQNQTIILNRFFNRQNNNFTFKFKVQYRMNSSDDYIEQMGKERNRVVKVSYAREDYVTIPEFYQNYKHKFNYLMAFINLLADVCMDRNNYAIQAVEFILPLSVVSVVVTDMQIIDLTYQLEQDNIQSLQREQGIIFPQTQILQPFIRIAHHAYVNNQKFSAIKRIKRIKKWQSQYDPQNIVQMDINKTKRVYQGQKQQDQKRCLEIIRDYIKDFLKQCDQQSKNLQILNTVLSLLKEMIILGLWETIQDFRLMIPDLVIKILKIKSTSSEQTITDNFSANKNLQLNGPQGALLIDCKIKATQIFKYMTEMQVDIRLRYIMRFFQGLYDATQNFQVYNTQQQDLDLKIDDQQQKSNIIGRNIFAKQQFFKIFGSAILGDVKKVSQDQDIMLKGNIWYNKLKKMIPIKLGQTQEIQFDQTSGGDRSLFKQSQDFDNIIHSLFQLTGYQNQNLLNSSLTMLRAVFGERRDLIQNFNQMLICGKGNLNQVYLTLKFMRNKFEILSDHSILKFDGNISKSFPYAIWKPYDHLGRQQSKRSGIIQDLFFLARTLKDNVSLKNIQSLMHVEQDVFKQDIVYNFYNQREKNNSLFQQLNMAQGIYVPLINYIQLVGQKSLSQIHRKLLFSIYQYLTLLCFNNMKAKHILMRYIPDILKHLNKKVGAASFLYEVCINNKLLVNNQELVNTILEGALNACISLEIYQDVGAVISTVMSQDLSINNDYQKCRILYSLRGVLLFSDEGHRKNQEILMDKLQDNKYRRLVYNGPTHFKAQKQHFDLSPPQAYVATHFQLFSTLVESENLINIGKLQNLHPYRYCLKCLNQTNRWQLRRSLRSYINRLYYINKDKDIFMFEQFIRQQFLIINVQLKDLIDLHKSKMLTQNLKIKNGVRFVYALSDIILMIIEIMITLHEMFLKSQFHKILKKELNKEVNKNQIDRKLHNQIIQLLENLGCIILLYPKTKPIASFIRQIKRLMTPVLELFHVRFLQKKSQPKQGPIPSKQQNQVNQSQIVTKKGYSYDHSRGFFRNLVEMIRDIKSREKIDQLKQDAAQRKNQINMSESELKIKYIDIIFSVPSQNLKPIFDRKIKKVQQQHYKPHLQTAHSKVFRVLAKPDLQQNQQNIQLNKRLSCVKQLMSQAPIFQKLKDDQFYNLVRIFKGIQPTTRRQIIINIFKLIMSNPENISDDQKVFVIKLIRCYISEAVEQHQNYKLGVDKWNADYYSDQTSAEQIDQNKSELVTRQHQIELCGGSNFIISIFKENLTGRIQLLNEALLLGIIYLYNGNKQCQNSILTSLKQDPANQMLISVKNIINFIGTFLIDVRKMKDYQKIRNFAYKTVDSHDHFNIEQKTLTKVFGHNSSDKFEIQTQLNFELALCRSFRFLQLFCESNNVEMKNFLLVQSNGDGIKKTNSINFVSQTCLLTRKLFKIMNNKVVSIPLSLLDFINQITQIPCIQTQLSLLHSTFFQDISYMSKFFQSKQNIRQRKFNFVATQQDDPLYQLSQIYQKGIGLAMSNFEGNNNQIIWEFLNKAQPKYLWIVIKQNLVKMLKQKAQLYSINKDYFDKQLDNSNVDKEILRDYREFLAQQNFIKALFDHFNQTRIKAFIQTQRSQSKTFRTQICNIINVIAILKKIDDYSAGRQIQALKDKQNPNLEQNQKAVKGRSFRLQLMSMGKSQYKNFDIFMSLFQELVLQIQVSSFNGSQQSFQNLYFPNHPVFEYLAPDTKDTIMFEVSRDTQRDKLISLLDYYQNVEKEIQWNYGMKYYVLTIGAKHLQLSITSDFISNVRVTARYVSYLICFMMFYFILVDHDTYQKTSYFTYYNYQDKLLLGIICAAQLTLTVLFFGLWLKMRSHLSLQKYLNSDEKEEDAGQQEQQDEQVQEQNEQAQGRLAKLQRKLKPIGQTIGKYAGKLFSGIKSGLSILSQTSIYKMTIDPAVKLIFYIVQLILALHSSESGFLSIVVFVTASFLGNFVGIQWYTMHLFDFFVGISLLTNVFKAILNNFKILSLLSGLAGCFILVFNIISLNTYVSVIYQQEVPAEACQDFLGCVLQLYTSGAIGDDMDQLYVGRFVFDTLYVVFMEMIFQGLVGGIIIDAFMGLKEDDGVRDEDKKNNCYICALTKPDMEKMGTTFNKHISNHYLWNYLFYIYSLKLKDQTDYTGMQYTITSKIAAQDVTWFPDNGEKDMSGQIQELVGQLKDNLTSMKQNANNLAEKGNFAIQKTTKGISSVFTKCKQLKEYQQQELRQFQAVE